MLKRQATEQELKAALSVAGLGGDYGHLYDDWKADGIEDEDITFLLKVIRNNWERVINFDIHVKNLKESLPKERTHIGFSMIHAMVSGFQVAKKPQNNAEYISKCLIVISDFFRIPVEKITGKKRFKEIVYARQLFFYFTQGKDSLKNLGNIIGGRDHSTVIHSVTVIENRLSDPAYREETRRDIENLKQLI